jgi:hypothetical protein
LNDDPEGDVADAEDVYRRVCELIGEQFCYSVEAGQVKFLHGAFNDPAKSPSVDRADLAEGDPHRTRIEPKYGVVTLQVKAIRERIGPLPKFEKGRRTKETYGVDVYAQPRVGNCAHAVIVIQPPNPSGGTFMKLKEGLVRLANEAGWTIEPNSTLPAPRKRWLRELGKCLIFRLQGRV